MSRYFLAETKNAKCIGVYSVQDVAALFNANRVQEGFVAAEKAESFYSYDQLLRNGNATWITVSDLLLNEYQNKPIVTVVLKDKETEVLMLSE